ncbi:Small integral membrane protein 12-A [Gryllus bimaculatus]|nr:Small integral membrane protein 12-A [Gryllus bimaculatus]
MLPALFVVLRTYAPYVTLPVAAVIGFIGYKIEGLMSDKYTPYQESIEEKREERLLKENLEKDVTNVDTLKEKKFVPRTVFEKNVSPSLVHKS